MKGHYIREAQPSGKLGRLAPYLKINEFPQLPKALKGPLRYCKSHSDMVSHSQHSGRIRERGLSGRPQTNASIFYSPNENQWRGRGKNQYSGSSGPRHFRSCWSPFRPGQVQEPNHIQPILKIAQQWHQETRVTKIQIS